MFSDPVFLVTALIAVLLVGLAKGGFSGIGMAATPLLALAVPPLQALAILLPILLVQDVVSLWWYRRDYDGWNLKVMLPGAVVGVGLAWAVGSVVSDDVVRLIIGTIGVGSRVARDAAEIGEERTAERGVFGSRRGFVAFSDGDEDCREIGSTLIDLIFRPVDEDPRHERVRANAVRIIDPMREEVLIKSRAHFTEDRCGLLQLGHAFTARRHQSGAVVAD